MQENILKLARQIKLMIFDIDGVFTDGKLYFSDQGEAMKAFNSLDGIGIKMLLHNAIDVAVITGRKSPIVTARAAELGIQHVYQGQIHKLHAFTTCLQQLNISQEHTAYMGDDIVDLPVMRRVALSISPANAFDNIKSASHWVTQRSGGDGAVREVCDVLLQAQDKWQAAIEAYDN